jgi:Flp pilus assembly protein TadG
MTRFSKHNNERGAAAVELALLMPILLLILVGIVEFGRGYHAKLTLTHAAREGARALAVGDDVADVRDVIESSIDGLDAGSLTIHGLASCTPGGTATISLDYDLDYSIPFWSEGSWDVDATGSMRCGG